MVKKYGAERGKGGVCGLRPRAEQSSAGQAISLPNAACCAGFESNLHAANPKIC